MASVTPSAPLGTDAAADRFGLRAATGVRPEAAAERRFRFELAAHPGSVRQARRLTRARLSRWAVCGDTCDTAALVVSELVTNAIMHTASRSVTCELHDGDELVRIAVRDEGCAPGEPHASPQRPDEEHGRGLLLVAAVSRAWGSQETGPGLLVWAELPRTTDEPQADTGLPHTYTPELYPPELGIRQHTGAPARSGGRGPDTEPRSDLGWSAKKPPADGRGSGAQAFLGTGAEWV
ncbi:ATP-binding protein [Streptomyces sp. NPDC058274]|uniref:ATP-binding protein n=1 Tax=Streptomyces sp. NPDC058274 TaxID=3346416 RepID=UPI0036E1E2F8